MEFGKKKMKRKEVKSQSQSQQPTKPCHYYRRIADAIFSPVEINKYDNAVQTNKQIFSLHKSYIFIQTDTKALIVYIS